MAKLTPGQIYAAARAAGFDPARAVIATAIAMAESHGGDPLAVGDEDLANGEWGPSVGLWQIRTRKAETGTGSVRDISALTGSVSAQAAAAYAISGRGNDWSPWTVYNTGAYQQYLGTAKSAAGDPNALTVGWDDYLPWNAPGTAGNAVRDAIGGVLSDSLPPARRLALTVVVVGLGLGLVAVGLASSMAPMASRARDRALGTARAAAAVVV